MITPQVKHEESRWCILDLMRTFKDEQYYNFEKYCLGTY